MLHTLTVAEMTRHICALYRMHPHRILHPGQLGLLSDLVSVCVLLVRSSFFSFCFLFLITYSSLSLMPGICELIVLVLVVGCKLKIA
jgi:hypothetical protein